MLINEKSFENILVYEISYKTLLVQNHCVLGSTKQIDLLEFMMELDIQYYSDLEDIIPFSIGLDIL